MNFVKEHNLIYNEYVFLQCKDHASHKILNPCIQFLDHEVLDRVIQTARCFKRQYNEQEIMAAIDHLLSGQPTCREKIDAKTPYFKEVRARVTVQAPAELGWSLEEVRQQIGYTEERGAEKTCAIVCWATTTKAIDWQST